MARVAEEFDGWAPELTALITDGETDPALRPIHALPVEHRWARVAGVTLLGDAAHLMLPSGEGANLAMFDGAELGKAIAANSGDVEAALIAYEKDLFPRSANAPQSLVDFLTSPSSEQRPTCGVGQSLSNKSGVARLTSLHPVRIMATLSSSLRMSNMSRTPDSPAAPNA